MICVYRVFDPAELITKLQLFAWSKAGVMLRTMLFKLEAKET